MTPTNPSDILQYGALGLCLVMIGLYFKILIADKKSRKEEAVRYERMFNDQTARMEKLFNQLLNQHDKTEQFLSRFFRAMEARPCLYENGKFMPTVKRVISHEEAAG